MARHSWTTWILLSPGGNGVDSPAGQHPAGGLSGDASHPSLCQLQIREFLDAMPDGLLILSSTAGALDVQIISGRVEAILGNAVPGAGTFEDAWPGLANSALAKAWRTQFAQTSPSAGRAQSAITVEEFLPALHRWVEARATLARGTGGSGKLLHVHLRDVTARKNAEAELERHDIDLVSAKDALERQAVDLRVAQEATEIARGQLELALAQAEQARAQAEAARLRAEQACAEAEAANKAKSSFLANMSHEIRSPMTAIVGYADLMLEPAQTFDQRRDALQTIRRNARHLLELVNDILDISKIEADKMTVARVDVDLPHLVAELVSMMRPRAIEKGLDFQLVYDGAVRRRIETDPLRLRQILVNLVGNAIKFTPTGMVMLRVTCPDVRPETSSPATDTRHVAPARVVFDVVDTGIGIATDSLTQLFQPFVQADQSTTRRFGGTGLGLTLSRRLARLLGGEITVESTVGRGSTFRVEIDPGTASPAEFVDALAEIELSTSTQPDLSKREPSALLAPGQLPPCRVLVAEDGKDNQRLIAAYLTRAGATVEFADNGLLALTAVERSPDPFDLILMDMQMPELDGYGATSELRQRGLRTPIVALTAHAMSEDRAKCLAAGCTDYLSKPIDREVLIATVLKHLGGRPRSATATPATNPTPTSATTPVATAGAARENLGHSHSSGASMQTVLSEFENDPDFAELLSSFVEGLPVTVGQIIATCESGRNEDLARLVHQLKGAGGGYGLPGVTSRAAATETALRNGTPESTALLSELVGYCRCIKNYRIDLEANGLQSARLRKSA